MKANPTPLFKWLLIATAIYIVGSIAWYGWLRPADVSYPIQPFMAEQKIVHPGDVVRFRVDRVNHTESPIEVRITRTLNNIGTGEETDLYSTKRTVPPHNSWHDTDVVISKATLPGKYRICGNSIVPNFLHDRVVPWCATDFQVADE